MNDTNICHCCDGLSVQTPVLVENRPGLKAVAYRVGTHPTFKQSLLARLSLSAQASLARLTTREEDDFSIGLLDAWSVVADVLSFYQERIANESFLNTATERFSVLEMARLIGYELNPGVAAGSYLAFTLDDTPGALGPAPDAKGTAGLQESLPPLTIRKGVKIQSVPGPEEKAQTFETTADIEARPAWNAMRPRLTVPQSPLNPEFIVFRGTATGLKAGDVLLVMEQGKNPGTKKVLKVIVDNEAQTTRVNLVNNPQPKAYPVPVLTITGVFSSFLMPHSNVLTQTTVNQLSGYTWREADISALISTNRWSVHEVSQGVNTAPAGIQTSSSTVVSVFRKRVPVFGYNAPQKIRYSGGVPVQPIQWDEWDLSESKGQLYLDNAYEDILPETYIAIRNPKNTSQPTGYYKITQADVTTRTAYGLSAKTTALSLDPSDDWFPSGSGLKLDAIRQATVYAQSEPLELAELPIEDVIKTGTETMALDRYYAGLKAGQTAILSGERSDLGGVVSSELIVLKEVIVQEGLTVISFQPALTNSYKPKTVGINANIAPITQGETVSEVLGSGDATVPFQRFTLRQPPLTYTSAPTPTGAQTTLEIRVNDLLWHEADFFPDHGPDERIYITRRNDEGKTTVIFGDGITGARLPTGKENVKAIYRKGTGAGGNLKANQLSQLLTKPLGVKSAVNPLPATGAEELEQLEEARTNAPLTILTLGRIVSLQDYEDFARAFAGIAKALATWTWKDGKRQVYITVAGPDGAPVGKNTDPFKKLAEAIADWGNPQVPVTLESYRPAYFQVEGELQYDPDYLPGNVLADVESRLRETFSFSARRFGQPVSYSEVVAVIQNTEGVTAVDIDYLYRSDANGPPWLNYILPSSMPGQSGLNVTAAELLTLDPRPIKLTAVHELR